jgi:ATP-binding protein involved in chromosome partitioning
MEIIMSKADIENLFAQFTHPETGQSYSLLPFIQSLVVDHNKVTYILESSSDQIKMLAHIKPHLDQTILQIPGIESVSGILTHHRLPNQKQANPAKQFIELQTIRKIIAVSSGKGGVGKSTMAINLAVCLQQLGLSVGLLDADIHGPSLPLLIGQSHKPDVNENKKMLPIIWNGISCMSIGFLVPENMAMVWRGPMVQGAIHQMLRDVIWPQLDVLIIDMPPGTGDAHLTIAQNIDLSGAIIVSTPQDIALLDARRAIEMYNKVDVKILGIIENMRTFVCPECGHESHIFGSGGAEAESEKLHIPFLGHIPLNLDLRITSDSGKPLTLDQSHPLSAYFEKVSTNLLTELFHKPI